MMQIFLNQALNIEMSRIQLDLMVDQIDCLRRLLASSSQSSLICYSIQSRLVRIMNAYLL